jgi:hypothetical protein
MTEQKKGLVSFVTDGTGEMLIATIKIEEPLRAILKSVVALDKDTKQDEIDCDGTVVFQRYQLRRWFSDSIRAEHRVLFMKELLDNGVGTVNLPTRQSAKRLYDVVIHNMSEVFSAIVDVQKSCGKVQVIIG